MLDARAGELGLEPPPAGRGGGGATLPVIGTRTVVDAAPGIAKSALPIRRRLVCLAIAAADLDGGDQAQRAE